MMLLKDTEFMLDEEIVAWLRRFLPDFYFVNAPLSRMRRHVEILQKRPATGVVIEWHQPSGAGLTELTVCAPDFRRPGLLSQIALALVGLKINVHTAWIHTLADPFGAQNDAPRVILNTLLVSESYLGRSRALAVKSQKQVEAILRDVLGGQAPPPVRPRFWNQTAPSLQVLDASATTLGAHTIIKLRAHDEPGVLFRLTSILAALDWNIDHAQINTFEREVDDVFFVSGPNGEAFGPDESAACLERLRIALSLENQV